MIEVDLVQIVINETIPEQVIMLQEKTGHRRIPIVIGTFEARAIDYHINDFHPPRPLTHDLLVSVIETLGAQVEYVAVCALKDATFYGRLAMTINGEVVDCDCRPSDAIALAVRVQKPIFVDEAVFDNLSSSQE